jgi:hypothetical protein
MQSHQASLELEEQRRRAKEIYRRRIDAETEAKNDNRLVAIDTKSEDLEIGDDLIEICHRMKARHPEARLFTFRVGDGGRAVDSFRSFRTSPNFREETR